MNRPDITPDAGGPRPSATVDTVDTVDIICSAHNAGRFVGEFVASLQAQTHQAWRLWLRDDGSADDTAGILRARAADDPRITLLHAGPPTLGATAAFGWLLEQVPDDARWVMEGDADDVWLPTKIERTLAVMVAEEQHSGAHTPLLVHTDLTVVDAALSTVHESFWRFNDINPEPITLRRLIVRNVATGPTLMLNRALVNRVGQVPDGALYQDWWFTLVAAAFGRIIAIRESTVLYRQHDSNIGGAHAGATLSPREIPGAAARALARPDALRTWMVVTARQAGALLERYGAELSAPDRAFLAAFARIPSHALVRRKLAVARLMLLPERGVLHNLSVLLRS